MKEIHNIKDTVLEQSIDGMSPFSGGNSDVRGIVADKAVGLLYSHGKIGLLATLINMSLLVFVIWGHVEVVYTGIWVVIILTITLARGLLINTYHRFSSPQETRPSLWRRYAIVGAILAGLAWGSASLLVFPSSSLPQQSLLALVVGGMVAGSVVTLSPVFPAFVGFTVTALLPLIFRFLYEGGETQVLTGVAATVFLVLIIASGRRMCESVHESLRLRESARTLAEFPFQDPDPLLRVNRDGELLFANPVSNDLLKHWDCTIGGKLPSGWRSLIESVVESGKPKEFEGRLEDKWIVFVATPVNERGDVNLYGRDITARKRIEKELYDLNDELESRVLERTAELSQAQRDLEADVVKRKQIEQALQQEKQQQQELITQLQEAQSQLLQSEKMASIGQLAAGVAHEINNPVGYIGANFGALSKYLEQIFQVLKAYENADTVIEGNPDVMEDINVIKQKVDLDYIKQDARLLVEESQDGVNRVRQIVQDLKDFSHVDEGEWQWTDIHKGLDSTLNIVHNEIKYKADVIKEYGELPDVECLGSQINQVFMNLLVNAAHAIEEQGVISIRTGSEGADWIWIEISDNGSGIKQEQLNRIFDPFFTTKPVGKGTGLGLSLSYSIINKHGGRIEVETEIGQGTSFTIWLPVRRQESQAAAAS